MIKKYIFIIILIFWLITDYLSKLFCNANLQEKINLIWDFLYLKLIHNSWIAFSIQIPIFFLKILTIFLILSIFCYYLKVNKNKNGVLINTCFWFILSWAIWNWIERVLYWSVTDFIWIKYFSIFNLADIFISLWVILLIFINRKKI